MDLTGDSTNTAPPWLGPGLPLYPHLAQVCRVYAQAVLGTNVYPCYVAQALPGPSLRDREPSYLYEPNGVRLGPGYYVGRLVGSFSGLPLYVTYCCPPGAASSSPSLASPGSPAPAPVDRLSLGQTSTTSGLNLTLPGLTLTGGSLLLAVGSVLGAPEGLTATFAGTPLAQDQFSPFPTGAPLPGTLALFSLRVDPARAGDLRLHVTGGTAAALSLQAVQVTGLSARVLDQAATDTGLATAPDCGATGTTSSPREYALGAFALQAPTGPFSWQNGFASGGQDVSLTAAGVVCAVTEGYRVLTGLTTVDAALSASVSAWAGLCATYR